MDPFMKRTGLFFVMSLGADPYAEMSKTTRVWAAASQFPG